VDRVPAAAELAVAHAICDRSAVDHRRSDVAPPASKRAE
jgi:hypothetical protein